jgi:hypothetical protein
MDALENLQISQIEETISQIQGIEAVRLVANGQGIEEIHVLSSLGKNSKQIARDIESALIAKHGIAIDYRKISIAQISADDQLVDTSRLKIKSISIETSELTCRVGVTLYFNEKDFEGVSQGSRSSKSMQRLVGEATLKALEKASQGASFALEGLETLNLGSQSAVCVCVALLCNGAESIYTGSALRKDGQENEAIVKAALSAINRRFNML